MIPSHYIIIYSGIFATLTNIFSELFLYNKYLTELDDTEIIKCTLPQDLMERTRMQKTFVQE